MKLISFIATGRVGFGALIDGNRVADLSGKWPSLRSALPEIMEGGVVLAIQQAPILPLAAVELTIPVPDAEKIICAGANFQSHAQEIGHGEREASPVLFIRLAGSFAAQGQPIFKPAWAQTYDYEAELAVVIGKSGRCISIERAMDYVAGYTLLMDGTIRNARIERALSEGKNHYRSGAMGPWMVTADEIPDPTKLTLIGRVNGEERQRASLSELVFDIPELIHHASRITGLDVGDIVSVGTPKGVGVGMNPPRFLNPGDLFETEVPGIGVLRNSVLTDPQTE